MIVMTALNYIALYLQILISKFRRRSIIGIDSADLRRRQYNYIRSLRLKELPCCLLTRKVQLPMILVYPFFSRFLTIALPTSPLWPAIYILSVLFIVYSLLLNAGCTSLNAPPRTPLNALSHCSLSMAENPSSISAPRNSISVLTGAEGKASYPT